MYLRRGCINIKEAELCVVMCLLLCVFCRWTSSLYPSTWTNGHQRFSAGAGRREPSETCKSSTNSYHSSQYTQLQSSFTESHYLMFVTFSAFPQSKFQIRGIRQYIKTIQVILRIQIQLYYYIILLSYTLLSVPQVLRQLRDAHVGLFCSKQE